MEDTIGLGPETPINPVNLPPPEADLPDTLGADQAPVSPPPTQSLPDTHEADQALPQPTQAAPGVDPVAPRPGDPNRAPITPQVNAPPAPAVASHRAARMDRTRPDISKMLDQMAAEHGVDPAVLKTLADIESSGDPNNVTGSYKGLFQMSDEEMAKYGGGASAFDPRANTLAAIRSLKAKAFAFEKQFGRLPTPTEFYLGHQQGEGGLTEHLKNPGRPAWENMAATGEGRSKGAAWAKKAIWGNIPDDMKPLFGSVENVTSAQFMAVWAQKVQGIPYQQAVSAAQSGTAGSGSIYGGPIQATGKVELHTGTAPSFAPAGTPEAAVEANKIAAFKPAPGFWQTVEAAADETTTAYLFRHSPIFAPDPGYQPTSQELELRQQGLPEKYRDRLIGVSAAHSDYLTQQAQRQFANEVTLSEAGWTGTGIGLVTSIVDPVDLSVGIASGGLGAFAGGAMKAGKLGQKLWAAGGGALGNVALTGAGDALGRATEGSDYAYAAAWGAGLGFAFGPLAKNAATRDIADAGAFAARKAQAGIEIAAAGEAGDLGAAATSQGTIQFSQGGIASMGQDDASRTAIASLRPDMAGRAGASKNPATRLLGAMFGFDVVDRVGPNGERVVNPVSVGEMAAQIRSGWQNRVYAAVYPQFDEWAKERGLPAWDRTKGVSQAWEDFVDEVYRYRADRSPERDQRYSKQAQAVDKALTPAYNDHLKGSANPRFDTPNNPGRPLAGMADVPQDPHYQPRKWRVDKINSADASGRRFVDWLEGALLSAHPELGDKAGTIAIGMHRNLVGRAFNVDEFGMIARNGASGEVLGSYMREMGIPEADVADILARLPKGTKPEFTHFKLDLDEAYVHPQSGLGITDFVETNALELFDHYNHQSSAWRALGRAQVADKDGKVLIDGIRSVNEFEEQLQKMGARGYDAGQTPKEIEADKALIREMFDRVRGVPHTMAGGTVDQLLEVGRNVSTMLFGGSFGLSALADAGRMAALGSVRSMLQHMPAFRTDIVEGGVLRPRSGLTRDLQAIYAYADEFRPLNPRWDAADARLSGPMERGLGRVVGATRVGAEAVLRMSGMTAVNRRIKEAASGIMAQRLFDDAKRAFTDAGTDLSRLKPAELERMKWFGMDDTMLRRVLDQLRQHATAKNGIFGEKITGFNPGNWTDPEALNAFATAIRRGAGRVLQEQDVVGAGTVFDRSPVFKSFMQLRRFALNAWHFNILHGRAMMDGEAFADVAYSTFAAAALYAVRTRMQASTQEDPEKFLRERFSPGAFSAAVFQLSAYSSLIPTIVDTFGANAIGADPIFGYRNSGLPSAGLFSFPTMAAADAVAQAPGAFFRPILTGRERSQKEWRQMFAAVPFQNNFLAQQALGHMVQGAPARPPKNAGYSVSDLLMNAVE